MIPILARAAPVAAMALLATLAVREGRHWMVRIEHGREIKRLSSELSDAKTAIEAANAAARDEEDEIRAASRLAIIAAEERARRAEQELANAPTIDEIRASLPAADPQCPGAPHRVLLDLLGGRAAGAPAIVPGRAGAVEGVPDQPG